MSFMGTFAGPLPFFVVLLNEKINSPLYFKVISSFSIWKKFKIAFFVFFWASSNHNFFSKEFCLVLPMTNSPFEAFPNCFLWVNFFMICYSKCHFFEIALIFAWVGIDRTSGSFSVFPMSCWRRWSFVSLFVFLFQRCINSISSAMVRIVFLLLVQLLQLRCYLHWPQFLTDFILVD